MDKGLDQVIEDLKDLGINTIEEWNEAQDEGFDNVDFFQNVVDGDDEMFELMDEVEDYLTQLEIIEEDRPR